ncbi:BTAD domain-containing putative transcriptional regulator [Streptomyces sp. CB01373]|uniref:BTAD domain-containing putative transcriptional regulator n=1 Tax=Streptomyces sp. CB01373 TaxID=2020325 RepID=UPI000C278CC5|nr:BTAD domain-containing putative transcriptional regulator [Streptomyces sp. CB01373]PJM91810.1 hypothetical protein CG719_31870 [Streptomyces sp. CB01373]
MTAGHLPRDASAPAATGPAVGTRPAGLRVVASHRGRRHRRDDGLPPGLFFGLLGPLEARGERGALDVGPPQRRALLLRLLMEDCRPVSMGRICDDLWNGRPPSSAASSVHAHISRLRSAMEESCPGRAPSVLASTSAGYVLRVAPDRRDTVLFEEAVENAHRLAAEGRAHHALRAAEEALALWRGQPYADARENLFARQEADRLTELHRSARDLRARLLLDEGRAEQAAAVCEELVGENPLRETSWVTLLRALRTAGRTAEALQRYETVRRTLADTLGTDPGPLLRQTHLDLLRQEPSDTAPSSIGPCAVKRSDTPAPTLIPAPTPAPVSAPTSRSRHLVAMGTLFTRAKAGRTVWVVLHGATGTGKSWLLGDFGRAARAQGSVVVHDRYPPRTTPRHEAGLGGAALRVLRETRTGQAGPARHPEPVLCLVDDVHNAPPEDLEALAAHADIVREAPLMVVCAVTEGRDGAVAGFQARLARSGARLVEVGPFDVADIEELLWAARSTDLPGALAPLSAEADRLHALTGGNAFYLTELLKPASPTAAPPHLPHVIRCEVRARLAALSPDARHVVETAALSGPVEAPFLARACALPLTDVLRALEDAADAGLMTWQWADGPSLPAAYTFSCELVRDALLADVPPSRAHAARTAVARARTRPSEPGDRPGRPAGCRHNTQQG